MKSLKLLSVLALAALVACSSDSPDTGDVQKISGSVTAGSFKAPIVGVRVVQGSTIVADSPINSDGSFTLEVPEGTGYRVEVVTRDGAYPLGSRGGHGGLRTMAFDVCDALADYSVGDLAMYDGDWGGGDPGDGMPPDGDPGDGYPDDGDCDDPPVDPCDIDPEWCDPCMKWPELCDPCLEDPALKTKAPVPFNPALKTKAPVPFKPDFEDRAPKTKAPVPFKADGSSRSTRSRRGPEKFPRCSDGC